MIAARSAAPRLSASAQASPAVLASSPSSRALAACIVAIGSAKLLAECGKTGGIERRRQSGAAIGNRTAIIGKIGAPSFEVARQRFRLVVRGLDKCRHGLGADITAMGAAQIADGAAIKPAGGDGAINRQRHKMVFIAETAPQPIMDVGPRRQAMIGQPRTDLGKPAHRAIVGNGGPSRRRISARYRHADRRSIALGNGARRAGTSGCRREFTGRWQSAVRRRERHARRFRYGAPVPRRP